MAEHGAWDFGSVKHRRLRPESPACRGGSGHVHGGRVPTAPKSVWSKRQNMCGQHL